MNVVGGILDEMNFMQRVLKSKSANAEADGTYNQAKRLYDTLSRRRRSRFTKKGKLPGILFIVSSSRFPDDFTELKAAESTLCGGSDPAIYVYSKSLWEAKPRDQFLLESFRVQVGNERMPTKVLGPDDAGRAGCEILEVPMDFINEFTKDPDGSLRDLAGRTTMATRPFLSRRATIHTSMAAAEAAGYSNIFRMEESDLSIGIPEPVLERLRLDVKQPRMAHLDLGLTKDACGIAIGHIAGVKVTEKRVHDDEVPQIEVMPVIAMDAVLRVVAPPGGEIEFAQVRQLLLRLRDVYELPIEWVTTDGFQSTDCRQILRRLNFKVDYLSVEKMEPYRSMRDALYEGRLLLPKHTWLAKELGELEVVRSNNDERVDHRPGSSKDVADAVCAVTNFWLSRRMAWASGLAVPGRTGTFLFGDREGSPGIKVTTDSGVRILEPPPAAVARMISRSRAARRTIQRKRLQRPLAGQGRLGK